MERKNLWSTFDERQLGELEAVSDKYRRCLDKGKTEREQRLRLPKKRDTVI